MTFYTAEDLDKLSGPHIQRAWFAHVVLPSGERRLHTGLGPVERASVIHSAGSSFQLVRLRNRASGRHRLSML